MKDVAKYNLYKGVSTTLTMGTPIVTLLCCGDFFKERSSTAISAAGMFTLFILVLMFKDKIAENFKMPGAFIVSCVALVLIYMIENIITPMKYVCWASIAASGVDACTFKRFYKQVEILLPKEAEAFKHCGFIFTNSANLEQYKVKNDKE